jgi:hypothetical protein
MMNFEYGPWTLLPLPTNVRLGWKMTNALPYFTGVKRFIVPALFRNGQPFCECWRIFCLSRSTNICCGAVTLGRTTPCPTTVVVIKTVTLCPRFVAGVVISSVGFFVLEKVNRTSENVKFLIQQTHCCQK